MDASIIIKNLTKTFAGETIPALNNISVTINPGQITGIVGPDGAGKTTLLRHIASLLDPSSGSITVLGHDTFTEPEFVHQITGYMPQKFGLYEDLSVLENLNLYADIFELSTLEREKRFDELLTATGMSAFRKRLSGRLSGGMKQKLGLTCALLRRPQILLLDEPSVGVDPLSRRELWKIVRTMVGKGTTVLWSTAYLDEAELCQEVIALNEGTMVFYGKPQTLKETVQGHVFGSEPFSQDKRYFLQEILKDPNVIDAVLKGDSIKIILKDPNKKPNLFQDSPSFSKDKSILGTPPQKMTWKALEPIFEDGFLNLLGGIKERESELSKLIDHRDSYPKGQFPITANQLTKKFGDFTAAKAISFSVKPGEVLGLLGPNGAGKSTTFRMLCGLLKPTEGSALLFDQNLRDSLAILRRRFGYMAQKFSLYGNLTVQQNLDFFSGIYGLAGKKRDMAIAEMIETFSLKSYLKTPTEELPLGFKQRLALSCSLMHRPPILFLDEPTSGVDPITRREFWLHINGMVQKGVTVLVTTHFMDEAEYCDRIVLIYKGQIIALGTPDELKKTAATKDVPDPSFEQTFIAHIEDFDRHHQDQEVRYDV